MFSIEDSSEPFRAFLGAILSVLKAVPVQPSIFDPYMEFDTILEEEDQGPLSEDDIDDDSGAYRGSSRTNTSSTPMTSSRGTAGHGVALMVRLITLSLPVTWLTPLLADYFLLSLLP